MATIDRRLTPLLDALTDADADWLAFEIIDGLRHGKVAQETQEDLLNARTLARRERPTRHSEERTSPAPAPVPISGDEQIDWATTYVATRISDVLSTLRAGLDQLDAILYPDMSVEDRPSALKHGETTLVLKGDHEEQTVIRRGDAAEANIAVYDLEGALLAWAESTRTTGEKK